MGRTLLPFRPALDREIQSWLEFRRGLRPEDREVYDNLMSFAREHAAAGSLAARPVLSEVIFFSILVEQQKQIDILLQRIQSLEKGLSS